jgi:hypothetical protein
MAGGLTKGKSHAKGGIKMVVKDTGQKIEVEGGEGIINKYVMSDKRKYDFRGQKKTACEIASDLNQQTGDGVKFNCDETKNTDMTPTNPKTGFAKGGLVSKRVSKGNYEVSYKGYKFFVRDVSDYVEGNLTWNIGEINEGEDWFGDRGLDSLQATKYMALDAIKYGVDKELIRIEEGYEKEDIDMLPERKNKSKLAKGAKLKRKKMSKTKKKTNKGAFSKLASLIMKRDKITYREAQKKAKTEYKSFSKKNTKRKYSGRLNELKSPTKKQVQQKKVSDKISLLRSEGKPQKQAVAIALDMKDRGKLAKGGDVKKSMQKISRELSKGSKVHKKQSEALANASKKHLKQSQKLEDMIKKFNEGGEVFADCDDFLDIYEKGGKIYVFDGNDLLVY